MSLKEPCINKLTDLFQYTKVFDSDYHFGLRCPFCGSDYVHFDRPVYLDGQDKYKAWSGRGDAVRLPFWGECGSKWDMNFGFHKGQTFLWITAVKACWREVDHLLESPIEEMFWTAASQEIDGLTPQHQIGQYRVDFAIPHKLIVIELDGHRFHKTKEQRTSDAKRERDLQCNGWRVIRFTGSEIYSDTRQCVEQVKLIIEQLNK